MEHDAPAEEQLVLDPEERAAIEVAKLYGKRKLVDDEGRLDRDALAELILPIVSMAVVDTPAERARVAVPRSAFMAAIFPEVVGEAEWVEQEDPELAKLIYGRVDSDLWRQLSDTPDGKVQARLNGEQGVMLCRTRKESKRGETAYVTRNYKCIVEDVSMPARKKIANAAARHGALMALAIERVPEHRRRFNREYDTGAKLALDDGRTKVRAALQAAELAEENGDEPSHDGGDE